MESVVKFVFSPPADPVDVELEIALAILAAESLYGKLQVRVETGFFVEVDGSACAIKVAGPAGESAARIFAGFAAARFGEEAYHVERRERASALAEGEVRR